MPETPLLLGSSNPGKLREMRELLAGMTYRVVAPGDVGLRGAPAETGATFMENAVLKARHYASESGLLAVADDSGLSVDALGGGPGLYSSRFGGEGATDDDRNRVLLERLKDLPPERRGARFTSADPSPSPSVRRSFEAPSSSTCMIRGSLPSTVRAAGASLTSTSTVGFP